MLNGIDISGHQGNIDLSALDIDFVIVKGTEGTGYVNPWCDPKVQQARELGLLWGFYHFASGYDAKAEADYFVDNCIDYFGEGIPVLDFEADAVNRGSWWAKTFLDRVYDRTGVRPLIYMSQSVAANYDWSHTAPYYGLWAAKYPPVTNPDFSYNPEWSGSIGAWKDIAIWQYASDGRIPGYGGNLDLNHAYMDADAWMRYVGKEEDEEMTNDEKRMLEAVYAEVTRTDDPTGRGHEMTTHEHVKWIAAAINGPEGGDGENMEDKFNNVIAAIDALNERLDAIEKALK